MPQTVMSSPTHQQSDFKQQSTKPSILRIAGSLWFAGVVLVLLLVAMACATVYETMHGTEQALMVFYKSWWFESLLFLFGMNVLCALILRYPYSRKQVGFVLAHGAILLVLLGALVTKHFAVDGQVAVTEGQTTHQYTVTQDVLSISNHATHAQSTLDLSETSIGGLTLVDHPAVAALALEKISVQVEKYLPDSSMAQQVLNDNPTPQTAVEVLFTASGTDNPFWLFADQPAGANTEVIRFRKVSDKELADLLHPATQPAGKGTVRVEYKGSKFEVPVDGNLDKPVKVGNTDLTLRILRYMPHAVVGGKNEITNASNDPVNPAVEVQVTGPTGTEKRLAFARFPEFSSMHGRKEVIPALKLTFIHQAGASAAAVPVEVVESPGGKLWVRFTPDGVKSTIQEATLGNPLKSPWGEHKFSILRRFDHARADWTLVPVPVRTSRQPGLLLNITGPAGNSQVWVQKDASRSVTIDGATYDVNYGNKTLPLGFDLTLDKFTVGRYPGSMQPRSFESRVAFHEPALGADQTRIISMNHPATYKGYTFYQMSYQEGERNTSMLSVSWDPGQPIVFAGYLTMLVGVLVVLFTRVMKGKVQGSGFGVQGWILAGMGILLAAAPGAWAGSSADLDLSKIRALPVQHDGRWMPLDTLARDMVHTVTGNDHFQGQDPVRVLLAWTFEPEAWRARSLITIKPKALREQLALPADQAVYSFNELTNSERLTQLIQALAQMPEGKPDPLESKVSDIRRKLDTLSQVFQGQVIKLLPDAKSATAAWQSITKTSPKPVRSAWVAAGKAFLAGDSPAFTAASNSLIAALDTQPAVYKPDAKLLRTEIRYNQLRPFRQAWLVMLAGAVLAAAGILVRRRGFDVLVVLALLGGFVLLSYGMWLRWQVAGHIPASNMFESLLFLSWGMSGFAIVSTLVTSNRLVPLTASVMGAVSLILADCLPLDHFIRPIAPVLLDTIWMSIHVPVIMVSYSVLALAVLIAHVLLLTLALAPGRRAFIQTVDTLHYWYVYVGSFLLLAGIVTGSMWAASSWGRYWGWDPKEVWSLVALLGYLAILHIRLDRTRIPAWAYGLAGGLGLALFVIIVPKLAPITLPTFLALVATAIAMAIFVLTRSPFATALKSILAFWLILMTYVGVNYVLGMGLHSYAFGTGAVAHNLMLAGGIDLAFVGLCSFIYLARSARIASTGSDPGSLTAVKG